MGVKRVSADVYRTSSRCNKKLAWDRLSVDRRYKLFRFGLRGLSADLITVTVRHVVPPPNLGYTKPQPVLHPRKTYLALLRTLFGPTLSGPAG